MNQSHCDSRKITIDFSNPSPVPYSDFIPDQEGTEDAMRAQLEEGGRDDPEVFIIVSEASQLYRDSSGAGWRDVSGALALIRELRSVHLMAAQHLWPRDSNHGRQEVRDD